MKKFTSHVKQAAEVLWLAGKRLIMDDFTNHASALAFVTVLSIVPLVSVIVYIFSFFPEFQDFIEVTQRYIYSNFVPTSSDTIQTYLSQFTGQASKLPILSILFSLFTGVMFVMTIEHALNDVWCVDCKPRSYSSIFLVWILILLLPLFIGLTAVVSEFLFSFLYLDHYESLVVYLLHFCMNSLSFAILYLILPNESIKWRDALLGGVLVAALFEVSKRGFVMYIKQFATYEYIYGALSIVPIFLLWIYISWCIILFGALVIESKYQVLHPQTRR